MQDDLRALSESDGDWRGAVRMSVQFEPGKYDFGLTRDQERRAAGLHGASIIVDLLSQGAGGAIFTAYPPELQADFRRRMASTGAGFDALAEAKHWPFELALQGVSNLIERWFKASGLTCCSYPVRVDDGRDCGSRSRGVQWRRLEALPWIRFVTTASEIRLAKDEGTLAYYGNYQPVDGVPRDLNTFDAAYKRGLRSFMLTYNQMSSIGVGCTERVDAGLSRFGVDVVRHCNDIGVIVDVSHCGHLTTLDACRHSRKPVNANHTSARGLSRHARGKADDALRAIADTGGVIGVVALPAFLTQEPRPGIEVMLDHIDYIANVVGWRHVAIGTDHPMQAPDDVLTGVFEPMLQGLGFREEDRFDPTQRLLGFSDWRDFPNITRGLVRRGYSDEEIRGILGENALRVFTTVWG